MFDALVPCGTIVDMHRWKKSHIQSLMFDADVWTPTLAVSWAIRHGFAASKVHLTDHYVRLRQVDPIDGRPKRTICLDEACHIKAIVEG